MTILRQVSMICNPSVYHICVHVHKVPTFLDSFHPSFLPSILPSIIYIERERERERSVCPCSSSSVGWLVGCVVTLASASRSTPRGGFGGLGGLGGGGGRASRVLLLVTTVCTALCVNYVHSQQHEEKLRMRAGLEKDTERLRRGPRGALNAAGGSPSPVSTSHTQHAQHQQS